MSFQLSKEVTKMPYYALFIIFIALAIVLGGKVYLDQDIDISGIENNLLVSRIVFSEDCLASEKLGEINLDNFNENQIIQCTGLNPGQGLLLKFNLIGEENDYELEFNKELTSNCIVDPARHRKSCDYYKYYFVSEGKGGYLEVLIANEDE